MLRTVESIHRSSVIMDMVFFQINSYIKDPNMLMRGSATTLNLRSRTECTMPNMSKAPPTTGTGIAILKFRILGKNRLLVTSSTSTTGSSGWTCYLPQFPDS